ncbi:hypothetical protein CK203_107170 [Vitis vinifera]|uniref:Uncharacterized protein n=1 Tax=Vitis vinifera TaxID=29760 RepID=A0A438CSX9_VITVI|nr:hypothetical protein CK203_107170 [Vitis vinifera]
MKQEVLSPRTNREPIKTNPSKQDWNRRCSYHKDHDHTTEQCKSLHYLVEKLIKVGVRPIDDTITFPLVDLNRVLQPHEDALVLTLGMDYSPSALKNPRRLLFEFNGAMTTSQSDIVLPVQVGPVTLNMVSYLTEEGQVDSLGNQLITRQCYQVALDSEHPVDDEAHPKSSNTRKQ